MEVFMSNLPDQITDKQIRKFLEPFLAKLYIFTYHVQKIKGKGCATLVIADAAKGQHFMAIHGQTERGKAGFVRVRQKLFHIGRPITVSPANINRTAICSEVSKTTNVINFLRNPPHGLNLGIRS